MCSNYFGKLTLKARDLEDGIRKLVETWKLPHILVGRFAECTEETSVHTEALWNTITNTQDGITEIISEISKCQTQNSVSFEEFLQESREAYEELKTKYDELNTVLAEHGYHYDGNDSLDLINANGSTESSLHPMSNGESLEIEFTPDLSWKRKVKINDSLPATFNGNGQSQGFRTPVISSLNPVSKMKLDIDKVYAVSTPAKERPQEPIYSKHFSNALKK